MGGACHVGSAPVPLPSAAASPRRASHRARRHCPPPLHAPSPLSWLHALSTVAAAAAEPVCVQFCLTGRQHSRLNRPAAAWRAHGWPNEPSIAGRRAGDARAVSRQCGGAERGLLGGGGDDAALASTACTTASSSNVMIPLSKCAVRVSGGAARCQTTRWRPRACTARAAERQCEADLWGRCAEAAGEAASPPRQPAP